MKGSTNVTTSYNPMGARTQEIASTQCAAALPSNTPEVQRVSARPSKHTLMSSLGNVAVS